MERLTFEGNFCDIAMCQDVPGGSFCENGACSQRKVWERLKAYEDTGLEPEEVNAVKLALMGKSVAEVKEFEGVPIDRLRELAQADKEGRCVVLPCKVGDVINAFRWNDEKGIYIISDKVTSVTVNKNGWTVKTKEKFYPIKEKEGYEFALINEYPNALADFYVGTREEAEKALGGGQDEPLPEPPEEE